MDLITLGYFISHPRGDGKGAPSIFHYEVIVTSTFYRTNGINYSGALQLLENHL